MVLFLLSVSSLLAVMTANYVRSMMAYSGNIHKYYKAFYLANAGNQRALIKANNRLIGFQDIIAQESTSRKENFECASKGCQMTSIITARSNQITKIDLGSGECTEKNAYILLSGESLIVPLFYDNFSGELLNMSTKKTFESAIQNEDQLRPLLHILQGTELGLGLALGNEGQKVSDENDVLYKRYTLAQSATKPVISNDIQEFLENKLESQPSLTQKFGQFDNFLIINNPRDANQLLQFCLYTSHQIPKSSITIQSNGKYQDRQVGLQTLKNTQLPDFIVQTYIGN